MNASSLNDKKSQTSKSPATQSKDSGGLTTYISPAKKKFVEDMLPTSVERTIRQLSS